MKIVKTAAGGSLIALAGAGGVFCFAPAVPRAITEILIHRPGYVPVSAITERLVWAAGWSAISAVAFAAGLIVAMGALARAHCFFETTGYRRPLLYLAAALAMTAAAPLLYSNGYFFLYFRALLTSDVSLTAEQAQQSLVLGPLYVGFAFLIGISGSLLAASFGATNELPRRAAARWLMPVSLGLAILPSVVFAAMFVLIWDYTQQFGMLVASHEQIPARELGTLLYCIVIAQLFVGVCMVALSIGLGGLARVVGEREAKLKFRDGEQDADDSEVEG